MDEELSEEQLAEVERWVAEESERLAEMKAYRETHDPTRLVRPEESALRKLDSSLKKNTAFLKRVKALTESQRAGLVKDFVALNLSKYVEEIAGSLVEVKLKITDVPTALSLACLAHQRYPDFAECLLHLWKKVLPRKKTDKVVNASKLRVDLRFFADLIIAGVFPQKDALIVLGGVLGFLVMQDKKEHANLPIIVAFAKYCGVDYTGLVPRRVLTGARRLGLAVPRAEFLSAERQAAVKGLLLDYFGSVSERALAEAAETRRLSARNRRLYLSKGEVFEDAEEALKEAKAALEKTLSGAEALADLLDQDPPPVPADTTDDELLEDVSMIVGMESFARPEEESGGLWEDEDTRQFYETIPELKEILPSILYKESMESSHAPVVESSEAGEAEDLEAEVAAAEAAEAKKETSQPPPPGSASALAAALEEEDYGPREEAYEEEEEVSSSTLKLMMDAFLVTLPTLVNRDMIDTAATDFVTNLNTKGNRKRLTRALFDVPRTRLDLLPFYSRLVAILCPVMPDVGYEISDWLRCQFKAQLRRKDQIKIESKIKTVRFIGELVKFGVFPKSEALQCLKTALFDLRHHTIDMSCALLETCGHYLYHSPESYQKTKILLALMMRKRSTMNDPRYQLMIDNAFYATNPPVATKVERKRRPPLHEYIRKLLFKELSKTSVEKVLKQLRKLNWTEREAGEIRYALKALASPHHIKYSSIQWLASVVAGLMWYHDWVGFQVVDAVLEDIRLGCELNDPRLNQRRLANLKYLGEMYNYRVIDSQVIFSALYSLILFGVSQDPKVESPLDPSVHLFRLRLVTALLDTCGEYFASGSSGRKLDYFLAYFQRYYWRKRSSDVWNDERPFPVEIKNLFLELLEKLRPKLKPFESLEASEAAVAAQDSELKEKVGSLVPEAGAEVWEEEEGLAPITEEAEEHPVVAASQSPDPLIGTSDSDSASQESEEEEEVHVRSAAAPEPCPEDDDFLGAFEKMMADSISQRVADAVTVPAPDISVPSGIRAKLGRKATFAEPGGPDEDEEEGTSEAGTVRLSVLTRSRGGKVAAKGLRVPAASGFVAVWREAEAAEAAEKERIKAATLSISRRMEAEERAILGLSTHQAVPHGAKKDRKPRFNHPKGAPSTKEIFGDSWK